MSFTESLEVICSSLGRDSIYLISLIPVMQIAFYFHIYDQQVASFIAAAASSVFCLICKITHNGLGAEGTKLTVRHLRGLRWAADT